MHDLAARLARGEEAAFTELYDACADRLHHYLAGRLHSRDAAADVLQDVFLRAVKSRRRFRGVENPLAYLFQIARNEAARSGRRRPTAALPDSELLPAASGAMTLKEDAELIGWALERLAAEDREIVELKIYGGLTFREIADVVERPQATVATRYRRALESMRDCLARQLR